MTGQRGTLIGTIGELLGMVKIDIGEMTNMSPRLEGGVKKIPFEPEVRRMQLLGTLIRGLWRHQAARMEMVKPVEVALDLWRKESMMNRRSHHPQRR